MNKINKNLDRSLSSLDTYINLKKILEDAEKFRNNITSIDPESLETQDELDTRWTHLDFRKVFTEMIICLCKSTEDKESISYLDKPNKIYDLIAKILGDTLKSLAYNADKARELKNIVAIDGFNHKDNNAWLPDEYKTTIKSYISDYKSKSDETIHAWTSFFSVSESSVYSKLVSGPFSYHDLRLISYCLLMRALITYCLPIHVYYPLSYNNIYDGISGLRKYYDGYLTLDMYDDNFDKSYFVKFSNIGVTGVSMINEFSVSLEDLAPKINDTIRGILFIPGYPTKDTLRAELYWSNTKHLDITVFYLSDLFELFRFLNTYSVNDLWSQTEVDKNTIPGIFEKFFLRRVNE